MIELREYIRENILPIYKKNEPAHDLRHVEHVIRRSFDLVSLNNLDVNLDMVYTIAAYHDVGHNIDSKNHEEISSKILFEDKELRKYFTEEEILIMSEAVADHRASLEYEPRSIYGKIVSSADRNTSVEQCLERSYFYNKKLNPDASEDEIYENTFDALTRKFGENGYAKFYFDDLEYKQFLKDIRVLLADKKVFSETQKAYIKKYNSDNKKDSK